MPHVGLLVTILHWQRCMYVLWIGNVRGLWFFKKKIRVQRNLRTIRKVVNNIENQGEN